MYSRLTDLNVKNLEYLIWNHIICRKSRFILPCNGASEGAASREREASGGSAEEVEDAKVDLAASATSASLFLLLVPA